MEWTVEDAGAFVVVRTSGVFDISSHRRMIGDILSRRFWAPGRAILFDHRALSFDGAGYRVMSEAVDNHMERDEEIGGGRSAILVGSTLAYGVARIFDGVSSHRVSAEIRIFTDPDAAAGWLEGRVRDPTTR